MPDLFLPDLSLLSPRQRQAWAVQILARCSPGRPASHWLGAEVLCLAARTELDCLRREHPELFPARRLELVSDNPSQSRPRPPSPPPAAA
jgi:hypothetical protein